MCSGLRCRSGLMKKEEDEEEEVRGGGGSGGEQSIGEKLFLLSIA